MWFKVDYRSPKPVYEQIKDRIKEMILNKKLNKNDYLPSIRVLAESIDVNLNTVSRAYRELETEGYVYAEKGVGYVVCGVDETKIEEEIIKEFYKILDRLTRSGISMEKTIDIVKNYYQLREQTGGVDSASS